MKILAVETSAVAASCCICAGGNLLAQTFQNNGLTHSRTLMPMIAGMLENCGLTLHDMDVLAVAAGPGSFTGLRIGISAVKGLAWPENKPVCGVSTLEAMAWNLGLPEGRICCAMDARRKQVYNGIFLAERGQLTRLAPDRAISLEELCAEEEMRRYPHVVVGDGAGLVCRHGGAQGLTLIPAPENLIQQSAWGVARAAMERVQRGETISPHELAPNYLRLSQAERERLQKQKEEQAVQRA